MRRRARIQWQLTFYLGSVVCLLMLGFLYLDKRQQTAQLIRSRAAYMTQQVQLLRMAVVREPDPQRRGEFLENYCATMRYHGRSSHVLAVVDPSGGFHSTAQSVPRDYVLGDTRVKDLLRKGGLADWLDETNGTALITVAATYRPPGSSRRGVLFYTEPLDDIMHLSDVLFIRRATMLLMLLAAVIATIWLFVRHKVSAPLNALLAHEYAVGKGDFRPRPYPDPNNEISEIYDMFNLMLKKIERREIEMLGPEEPHDPAEAVRRMEEDIARISHYAGRLQAEDQLPEYGKRLIEEVLERATELRAAVARAAQELRFHERGE